MKTYLSTGAYEAPEVKFIRIEANDLIMQSGATTTEGFTTDLEVDF